MLATCSNACAPALGLHRKQNQRSERWPTPRSIGRTGRPCLDQRSGSEKWQRIDHGLAGRDWIREVDQRSGRGLTMDWQAVTGSEKWIREVPKD